MYAALYYPHTSLRDDALLKTSLLLWDHVEVLVPSKEFRLSGGSADGDEATELIGVARHPSDEEKQAAHDRIMAIATNALPEWLAFDLSNPSLRYEVYSNKFLEKTWDALRESKLATRFQAGNFEDHVMSQWLGLTMMSILAEECAGEQKRLLTDEQDSYSALSRSMMLAMDGGSYLQRDDVNRDRLLTLNVRSLNSDGISLRRLIDLRKNEDAFLRELRHKYLAALDECIGQVSSATKAEDRAEIERVFEQRMRDDLTELRKALRSEAAGVLFSKEVLVTILAGAGALVEPWTSSVVGVGALGRGWRDYRNKRAEAMRKHPMSWLLQTKRIHFV